ncbi:MAG: methionine--tRNA ligase [Vicinamibacterales bacterium]
MSRFYLTTAIDYVNNRPHLGTAYEKIAADVIARYRRLAGDDVRFVMGNDEHSQNVFKRARESNLEPLEYCDRMAEEFRTVWSRLNISFDDFIRTTEPRHKAAVQAMVQHAFDSGDVYEGLYEGWYCVSCEEFKPEKSLIEGQCPVHRTRPDWISEKNFFFRLSKYRDALLSHYATHPSFVAPDSRRNEMLRLIEGGLEDISVSRAGQAWGIPLPFSPQSVVYVWYDALINYAAAVGYGTDEALFDRWWTQTGESKRDLVHLVGKDITRFHCVVWPAMLLSAGLPLPTQVFGHGWVLFKGEKMSKSLGTVVDPLDIVERFGPDPLRLFLTKEIVFGNDGDFSWDRFEEKYNADLANNLGNLVSRLTAMADRYRKGRLKATPAPADLAIAAFETSKRWKEAFDRFALDEACAVVFQFVDRINEYIATEAPWKLAKEGANDALDGVLWNATEALRIAAVMLSPVMPGTCDEIRRRIGDNAEDVRPVWAQDGQWRQSGERVVVSGPALWPRLEPKETVVSEEITPGPASPAVSQADGTGAEPNSEPRTSNPEPRTSDPEPRTPQASQWPLESRISIEDFMKIDLRVAKVLTAEKVPNSKKLVKLTIDLGSEQRTLVAGIAEAYEADALVGRTVAIVANLKPAKRMGIESNGMILAGSPDGGKPALVAFEQPPAPGTRIR